MDEQGRSDIRKERPLEENEQYEEHYRRADRIEIVGIACKGFLQSLYPSCYGMRDLLAEVKGDRKSSEDRLTELGKTALFRNIRERELHVVVFMANPFSDFVRIRAKEENNPMCRNDILNGIDLLGLMAKDLNAAQSKAKWRIRGSFNVFLYQDNPYISVFCAWYKERKRHYLAAGFLFQNRRGYKTPQVIVRGNSPLVQAVSDQLVFFQRTNTTHTLFNWDGRHEQVTFNYKYPKACRFDVFLCYNRRDKSAVKEIAVRLREHGILPWLDDWELGPQGVWIDELERALKEVNCVAVFLGPDGEGPWQEFEIRMSLDWCARKNVGLIPVVLKGVEGEPRTTEFLRLFQWVDFRAQDPDPMDKLVERIKGI